MSIELQLSKMRPIYANIASIAELLIQVAAEHYMGYHPREAIIIQRLWMFEGFVGASSPDPVVLDHILKGIKFDGDEQGLKISLRRELLQHICFGLNCDLHWEALPQHLRRSILLRSVGISSSFREEEASCLNLKLERTPGSDLGLLLSKHNYAAFMTVTLLEHTTFRDIQDLALSHIGNQYQQSPTLATESYPSAASFLDQQTPLRYSIYDRTIQYCGIPYHFLGSLFKFFSIAFVADPEYQRELSCVLSGVNNIVASTAKYTYLTIWKWAKAFQNSLLPAFLVCHTVYYFKTHPHAARSLCVVLWSQGR